MFCTSPISIYKRGDAAVLNAATGLAERMSVACGQCPTCQAGRKNDWSGRLIAEAKTSKQVYFLTLTYKKEPEDYQYRDVQLALKRLRIDLNRHHGEKTVRFFCVGERGNKKGRIHWHVLLFFKVPHHIARTKPGQLWEYWPHGWTSIDLVPQDDVVRRVRYCAKYAVKTVGNDKSCRLRCSLNPAIGGDYVEQFARDAADQRLALKGFFFIPGMLWERGHRKGEHVRYRMKGSTARKAAASYVERWLENKTRTPWPETNFLARYHPDQMMERFLHWPETHKAKLGKLAEGQQGRLSFRKIENPYANLWGAVVNVEETESERVERLEVEEFFLNAAAQQDLVERKRRAEDDRAGRYQFALLKGYDIKIPGVRWWIDHGWINRELEGTADSNPVVDFERYQTRRKSWRAGDVHPQARPSEAVRRLEEFAFCQSIRKAGQDAVYVTHRVTGECKWVPQARGRKAPQVWGPDWHRTEVQPIDPFEKARFEYNRACTEDKRSVVGSLAERAYPTRPRDFGGGEASSAQGEK